MSQFDPNLFLSATSSEPNVKRPPLPVQNPARPDGFYMGVCKKPSPASGEKDGKPWYSVAVQIELEIPEQLRPLMGGKPTLTLTDRVFLDVTPQGTLDSAPGANRGQRTYREATDLNKPGDKFNWLMIEGRPVKVQIENHMYQDEIQDGIKAVFKP